MDAHTVPSRDTCPVTGIKNSKCECDGIPAPGDAVTYGSDAAEHRAAGLKRSRSIPRRNAYAAEMEHVR